jgi:uncharacterized repeat protein (TIGR01451 family)
MPVNISRHGAHARATAALVTGLIALPVVTAPGHDGPTRAPKVPGLAISISDGLLRVRPGQVLTYTASLRNTGTVSISKLEVTEMLSAGLEIISASGNGVVKARQVTWSAALPAAGTRKFLVAARVTKTPAQMLRLAAVACVTLAGGRRPAVCAAHLDRLPAAAAGPASRSAHRVAGVLAYTAGGLAVLGLGLLTAIAARRRGRLRRRPA